MGREVSSLKFRDPPRLADVQLLYGEAAMIEQDSDSSVLWRVLDADKEIIGTLLRAAAVADNNVGFQGPPRFCQSGAIRVYSRSFAVTNAMNSDG